MAAAGSSAPGSAPLLAGARLLIPMLLVLLSSTCCSAYQASVVLQPVNPPIALFSNSQSCALTPRRPLLPPPLLPGNSTQCSVSADCPAPAQCRVSSTCVAGLCSVPAVAADGTACTDSLVATIGDVCLAGVCSGLALTCPPAVHVHPTQGMRAVAFWSPPAASFFPASSIALSANRSSGDIFDVGATLVAYTAVVTGPAGIVRSSCSFSVVVHDPCEMMACNQTADPCRASSGTCVAGACIFPPRTNGTACQGGVCLAGSCIDPCAGVVCSTVLDTACSQTRCVVRGTVGVCEAQAVVDGVYALPPNPPSRPPILRMKSSTTCVAGSSLCEAPLRYVPRSPLLPPPLVVSGSATCTNSSDCPSPGTCFQVPDCVQGICLAASPKVSGAACDDGLGSTVGDMCNGMGACFGLGLTCPMAVDLRPPSQSSARAWWPVPRPSYGAFIVSVTANASQGSWFPVGTTIVQYTASVASLQLSVSCQFPIIVHDPCENVVCSSATGNECAPTSTCKAGACVPVLLADGQNCSGGGVCVSGTCTDVCANVNCTSSVPCQESYCAPQGITPACLMRPKPNGQYTVSSGSAGSGSSPTSLAGAFGGRLPPVFRPSSTSATSATCNAGNNFCAAPLRYVPMALFPSPPLFPKELHTPQRRSVVRDAAPTMTSGLCMGRFFVNTTIACKCPHTCYSCHVIPGIATANLPCYMCKSATYLYGTLCVASCPAGTRARGSGLFGRTCIGAFTTAKTTTAATTTTSPPITRNASLDYCVGRNTTRTRVACSCGNNCFDCQWARGAMVPRTCWRCKNSFYLVPGNNTCAASCPPPLIPSGTGNFSRHCIFPRKRRNAGDGTTESGSEDLNTPEDAAQSGSAAAASDNVLGAAGAVDLQAPTPVDSHEGQARVSSVDVEGGRLLGGRVGVVQADEAALGAPVGHAGRRQALVLVWASVGVVTLAVVGVWVVRTLRRRTSSGDADDHHRDDMPAAVNRQPSLSSSIARRLSLSSTSSSPSDVVPLLPLFQEQDACTEEDESCPSPLEEVVS